MVINKHVKWYIDKYKHGEIRLNSDRIKLIDHLEIMSYTEMICILIMNKLNCVSLLLNGFTLNYNHFKSSLIAFVFLFDEEDELYFEQFFWLVARGAGKTV